MASGTLSAEGKPVCPRCGGFIPNNEHPGAYPGALSRRDNETEICSACGQEEAFLQATSSRLGFHADPWRTYPERLPESEIGER